MTSLLPSYVSGSWWTADATASASEVRDASTGEVVTRVSTEGLDLAGALEYARTVGQQSLGALTFHQRAVLLKQFALALTERKAELYELSARTGATKTDSWVDIDGGIGVLFSYSGKGRRELPMEKFLTGIFETALKDDELLVAIRVPKRSRAARYGYWKFCRKAGEFPQAIGGALTDPERGETRTVVGATEGAPRLYLDLNPDIGGLSKDAYTRQLHAVALKRALAKVGK